MLFNVYLLLLLYYKKQKMHPLTFLQSTSASLTFWKSTNFPHPVLAGTVLWTVGSALTMHSCLVDKIETIDTGYLMSVKV